MKLLNVILGKDNKYNNTNWTINKDQYDNDVVTCESTSQRIKVGKYLVPTLEEVYNNTYKSDAGEDIISVCDFSNDGHFVVNKKNLNIIMIKNSKDDSHRYDNIHLMYITIPTDSYKIIDSTFETSYAEVINTYRSNNMLGAVVKIDTDKFPNKPLDINSEDVSSLITFKNKEVVVGKFVLYNQDADEGKKIVIKTITVSRDLDKVFTTTEYTLDETYIEELNTLLESNFFKKILITPTKEIKTSVYIVNEKKINEFNELVGDNDLTIIGVDPSIFKKSKNHVDITNFDSIMKDHILNNKVRAVTVVGVKLPKEVYSKYKIQTCFSHDLTTGLIKCVKT